MGNNFWQHREHLATIYQYAQARRVGPWAVLGTVLCRVVAATSPSVVLPPLVGGYGSLNLFTAIVAPSGGGKGAAQAVGSEVLAITGGEMFPEINLGSGEGIVHAYVRREQVEKGEPAEIRQYQQSVLFSVAEIDTFTAIARRQGSTLASEIRKVWSGEALGFHNADETRRLHLAAHTYRAALIVGVQPGRAEALLDDADGGTPQRFFWVPAHDPHAPDVPPPLPAPIAWSPPTVPLVHGRQLVGVAPEVGQTIDENRLRALRDLPGVLDGHAMFTRLKIATALGLLDGRPRVNLDDWHLAGQVMEVSDHTRTVIQDHLHHAQVERNQRQAIARGHANAVATETAEAQYVQRAKAAITKRLAQHPDGMAAGQLRSSITSSLRNYFEPAIADLEADRVVTSWATEYRGQAGTTYALITP